MGRPKKPDSDRPKPVALNTHLDAQIRAELDELVATSAAPAWPGGPERQSTIRDVVEQAIHQLYLSRINPRSES